ncbi:DUF1993 domain-containing protein [Microbulbifer agarilyticus]|uniref:DUF1993 family protein n=1 Tax=Microbulbifer agarilyticus TaxID=260552 RepID=UPI001C9617E7|nr:DUF1993 family protein [Microbulbifer agarilyticus]MBY6211227.1 DUF1993 domain-containing protein [Microbulbifer agarilyticus]
MQKWVKSLTHYLTRLKLIISKLPSELFDQTLVDGMFSLEVNAKIAANFAMRGYCPLLGVETISFEQEEDGSESLIRQIDATLDYLKNAPDIDVLDDSKLIEDRAGFADIELGEYDYIHIYILPNLLFHLSMVYAIARSHGVDLSKADFDGLHEYPKGFSFLG